MAKPALQFNTPLTNRQLWAILAMLFLVAFVWDYVNPGSRKSLPSDSPKVELQTMAAILDKADRTGDRALAASLLDRMTAEMHRLESDPSGADIPERRSCMLAATQLAQGVMAVSQEGNWVTRQRYVENIKDCQ